MKRPHVDYIPPDNAPQWPLEARTMAEAFDMMRQPPKRMTRAELAELYPPNK